MIYNEEGSRLVRPPAAMLAVAEALEFRSIERAPSLTGNAEFIRRRIARVADTGDEPTFDCDAETFQLRACRDLAHPRRGLQLREDVRHDALGFIDGIEQGRRSLRREGD